MSTGELPEHSLVKDVSCISQTRMNTFVLSVPLLNFGEIQSGDRPSLTTIAHDSIRLLDGGPSGQIFRVRQGSESNIQPVSASGGSSVFQNLEPIQSAMAEIQTGSYRALSSCRPLTHF